MASYQKYYRAARKKQKKSLRGIVKDISISTKGCQWRTLHLIMRVRYEDLK